MGFLHGIFRLLLCHLYAFDGRLLAGGRRLTRLGDMVSTTCPARLTRLVDPPSLACRLMGILQNDSSVMDTSSAPNRATASSERDPFSNSAAALQPFLCV